MKQQRDYALGRSKPQRRRITQDLPSPSPLLARRPGVWIKEWWVRFFGMMVQTRMVELKLRDGLLLYSPGPAALDAATRDELAARI